MIKADLINKISLELNTPKQEPEEGPLFQAEQSPQGAHQQIMRYISAPWRADYVCRALPAKGGCVFCEAVKSRDDRASAVLYRGRRHIVLLNRSPYTPGHVMIAPRRHVADFAEARAGGRAGRA